MPFFLLMTFTSKSRSPYSLTFCFSYFNILVFHCNHETKVSNQPDHLNMQVVWLDCWLSLDLFVPKQEIDCTAWRLNIKVILAHPTRRPLYCGLTKVQAIIIGQRTREITLLIQHCKYILYVILGTVLVTWWKHTEIVAGVISANYVWPALMFPCHTTFLSPLGPGTSWAVILQ